MRKRPNFESLERRELFDASNLNLVSWMDGDGDIQIQCYETNGCHFKGIDIVNNEPDTTQLEGVSASQAGFEFKLADSNKQQTFGNLLNPTSMNRGEVIQIASYDGSGEDLSITFGIDGSAEPVVPDFSYPGEPHQLEEGDLRIEFSNRDFFEGDSMPRKSTLICEDEDGCYVRGLNFESRNGFLYFGLDDQESHLPIELNNDRHQYSAGQLGGSIFMGYRERWDLGFYSGWAGDLTAEAGGLNGEKIIPITYDTGSVFGEMTTGGELRRRFGDFDANGDVDFADFLALTQVFGFGHGEEFGFKFFLAFSLQYGEDLPRFAYDYHFCDQVSCGGNRPEIVSPLDPGRQYWGSPDPFGDAEDDRLRDFWASDCDPRTLLLSDGTPCPV